MCMAKSHIGGYQLRCSRPQVTDSASVLMLEKRLPQKFSLIDMSWMESSPLSSSTSNHAIFDFPIVLAISNAVAYLRITLRG